MIFFFFNDTATTEIYTLSLHDALPISGGGGGAGLVGPQGGAQIVDAGLRVEPQGPLLLRRGLRPVGPRPHPGGAQPARGGGLPVRLRRRPPPRRGEPTPVLHRARPPPPH